MRIALIWNFKQAKEIFPNWRDGHRAAFEEVAKKHQLDWFFGDDYKTIKPGYDFILFWTDATDPVTTHFDNYSARMGIILTSDNNLPGRIGWFDVVFCESEPVAEKVRKFNRNVIVGMGTDTDFYKPDLEVKRDIEYFYPATFSKWKLQSEIAYLGDKLFCVGTVQPDGRDELASCRNTGVNIEIGYFPAEKIRDYYNRAKKVIIPAIHGSERTVLEAMSMGIVPEVTNPNNVRTQSYLKEYNEQEEKPRDFIEKNYSHYKYAEQLLKGIEWK